MNGVHGVWRNIVLDKIGCATYYSPINTKVLKVWDRVILQLDCGHKLVLHLQVQASAQYVQGPMALCMKCGAQSDC